MEGIIFLWIMWGSWTYTTFIMKKDKYRFISSFLILFIIITSYVYIPLESLKINSAVVVLFFIGASLFKTEKKRQVPYYLIATFVMSMSYVLYHIYLIYDPAIRLIINPWLLILSIIMLNRLLVKPFHLRLSTLILGLIHGEVMRVLIFINYIDTIGSWQFLDHMSVACLIMIGWHGIETVLNYIETLVKHQSHKKIIK